jgi:hypothetical protein
VMPSGVTFFFEPTYLLARDKIVVPPFDAPTRQTTIPETYQPSDYPKRLASQRLVTF